MNSEFIKTPYPALEDFKKAAQHYKSTDHFESIRDNNSKMSLPNSLPISQSLFFLHL